MANELVDAVGFLVQELHKAELLARPQLKEAHQLAARCPDSRALARELVERGWLTAFQVQQLLAGRGQCLHFGPYLVLDRIGEGATGQVFKARHTRMQRLVALKILRPELLTDAEVVQRFYREVQVLSQLTSPYIVHAFDGGQLGTTYYLVLEYIEGADLDQVVKKSGPLGIIQASSYIYQAALGLQHAHEKGLVHRDIKPSNLLVARQRGTPEQALPASRTTSSAPAPLNPTTPSTAGFCICMSTSTVPSIL